ncbi:MAG: T9SS type A sorting domain-containing protein [Bacteroidia bacterium]|jgi:hypothetical protein
MKNSYALLFSVILAFNLTAQIAFDASHIPTPGTVHKFREGDAMSFPSESSGTNWNFTTTASLANDSSIYTYKSIAETPEAQYFPDANLVKERILYSNEFGMPQYIDTLLYFYRYDATGMYYHGLCAPGQEPYYPYVGESIEFPMPMQSGSVIVRDTMIDSYYNNGVDSVFQRRYVTRTFNVLAEGTLNILGIAHEVLAMTMVYESTDSTFIYSESLGQWLFDYSSPYSSDKNYFFSPGLGTAVLTGEFYNTELTDWTVSFITNAPISTSIETDEHVAPNVYPNPSHGAFQITNLEPGKFRCRIFDTAGRIVSEEEVNSMFHSTTTLPRGEYVMLLESANGKTSFTRKLLVK